MRGLVYKEFSIFYKTMDRKMIVIAAGFSLLLLYSGGSYGGLVASVLLAITVGAQNVISIVSDDKACWKKYQMAMPVSCFSAVASKYIAVVCTLGISLAGCLGLNLISSVMSHTFDVSVWGLSVFISICIPLVWTGVCLPLTYWFGVQSAQAIGLFLIIPVFYFVKYFEEGAGFPAMAGFVPYLWAAGILAVAVFGISLGISVAGYARRK